MRLGADPRSGRLPPDLTVVQLGDLVHRGPDSDGVVALVDRFLTTQAGQWVQLVGNHEAQYLRDPAFDWPERIGETAVDTLHRWWTTGQMQVAAVVSTAREDFLVTHAGLTWHFWLEELGAPGSAADATAALNALIGTRDDLVFRPGQMLSGRRRDRAAGPVWAATASELLPGWLGAVLPFSQVHGHASLYDWRQRIFRAGTEIEALTSVDESARHETTRLINGRIIGIDPDHGREAHASWQALELEGSVGPGQGVGP
jgi:hypothetical protein